MTFQITLHPAERAFDVARDETILSGAIRAGVGMPYGCRDGACGSCKSRLQSGRVIHGAHQQKALSDAEEASGLILTCCATPQTDCIVEARVVPGAGEYPLIRMPGRILALERAAPDVMILRVQLPANQSFRFRAGQYVEFILRDGVRRSYSMANAPHNLGTPPSIELHVRHMPGGKFTDHVFGAMKEKDIVRMEGPFGSFFLREECDKPIVLLASGTGFAPIKALIEQLHHLGSIRPVRLYWGARRLADLYHLDWVAAASHLLPRLEFIPVLSEPALEDGWNGRTGFVHEAVMADLPDLRGHQVYACGAPIMVESAERDFVARCDLPAEEFFADTFTSEADKHQP